MDGWQRSSIQLLFGRRCKVRQRLARAFQNASVRTSILCMETKLDVRYFPLVLDVVDQGIFTVDQQGRITSFNKAAELITGYAEAEVVGKECSSVFRSNLCNTVCPLRQS